MEKFRYVILGAGPAGLTFANLLKEKGENSFIVLEAEENAGGLCRSEDVDGKPLDIGGGHFLDVRRPEVNRFLFKYMPEEEWNLFDRNSKIRLKDIYIDHPIEANIWQMNIDNQVSYLESIARAGCVQGVEMPERFTDWIYWKLGVRIAEDYMIPYNSKIFSKNLNELGTYWLEKLPNVSFENTLRSCLEHKAYGEEPGHAQFYYPKKYGYGELWKRMAESIVENLYFNSEVVGIEFSNKIVRCKNGQAYKAEKIITTIPWIEFSSIEGMPSELVNSIKLLKHNSIQVTYCDEHIDTDAHWIYFPDEKLDYHRILVRHNFCSGSRGYWTETNCERITENGIGLQNSFYSKYAYPLNTIGKPEIMDKLISWSEGQNVYPLGRWGEHQHYNSDLTVKKAMDLFERIVH